MFLIHVFRKGVTGKANITNGIADNYTIRSFYSSDIFDSLFLYIVGRGQKKDSCKNTIHNAERS